MRSNSRPDATSQQIVLSTSTPVSRSRPSRAATTGPSPPTASQSTQHRPSTSDSGTEPRRRPVANSQTARHGNPSAPATAPASQRPSADTAGAYAPGMANRSAPEVTSQ